VAVIAAVAGASSVSAAKASTGTIPIVFTFAADPVKAGLVASLNRPGGNITGISSFNTELGSKGLELLHELIPNVADITWLANPEDPLSALPGDLQDAAHTFGGQLIVLNASTPEEIDTTFATLRQQHVGALVVGSNPFFTTRGQQITALAAHDGIPTLYFNREFVAAGGLMSYGNDVADQYRRVGLYVGRILKGEKPADLPVYLSTKFEFVINLKTAKALGLDVPPTLLATADEVIE
jgi:putative ABC transport system substrate-binding protein